VHGFYALTAVARTTADGKRRLISVPDAAGIAEERRALAADPDFEMPYGGLVPRLAMEYVAPAATISGAHGR
jgi:hypothetical protein